MAATTAADVINSGEIFNTDDVQSMEEEAIIPFMVVGFIIIAAIGVAFVGLVLGIIGAFSKTRRKVFSIIGIVLNGIIFVGAIALIFIGLAIGATNASSFV